ncbi:hypothetical protein AD945_00635 [Gluconobacter albidus]|uniref:Uncharacterized protein n=1 Tax=Gluconobacter albidus TaxID=318683 RepID=A0A149TNH6_9PROT|nr:DUF2786 domain-containing protein [Gluconobacter albidus]KXV51167.1 hypothetical protein AD945_00635 [Gluconobacter albidus]
MDKEKIVERIRKLLALAQSQNASEAASALAKVQELMARYEVDGVTMEMASFAEVHAEFRISRAERPATYALQLAVACRRAFGVSCIWDGQGRLSFYGDLGRSELAAYAFTVLGRQCVGARKIYFGALRKRIKKMTRIKRADAFAQGWVLTATRTLGRLKIGERETELLQLFKEQKFTDATSIDPRTPRAVNGQDNAYFSGVREGRNARLEHAMSGGGIRSLTA